MLWMELKGLGSCCPRAGQGYYQKGQPALWLHPTKGLLAGLQHVDTAEQKQAAGAPS